MEFDPRDTEVLECTLQNKVDFMGEIRCFGAQNVPTGDTTEPLLGSKGETISPWFLTSGSATAWRMWNVK